METIIKVNIIHSMKNIESFPYIVKDFNSLIVRRNLEEQNKKAVAILKRLNKHKIIGSIFIPKNKKMQKELDSLVKAKRQNKNSIDIIIATFK